MFVHVLGSSAGGGLPQWNCNCANCMAVRQGNEHISARTQSSIAISEDGERWILINVSPDIRAQLAAFPAMQPARGRRDTAISSIMLVDAQIDHTSGLLFLREGEPLTVYCTKAVAEDLSHGFPVFSMLQHFCGVEVNELTLSENITLPEAQNLVFTIVPVTGKAPPYSPHRNDPQPGDNVALFVMDLHTGKSLFYAPGLADIEPQVDEFLQQADCILVDGTFWTEDEMITQEVGKKRAAEMGHLPQSGDDGMMAKLKNYPQARKILIHINNTNPMLVENSDQCAELKKHYIEVAYDGMEIEL